MKKTDIAMIVLIASMSMLISYFIAKATPLGESVNEPVKVKTIQKFSTEITEPDPEIFNSNAVNPSVEITIKDGTDD